MVVLNGRGWVAGILAQVPLPAKGPPSFTNWEFTHWEIPLREWHWCSPLHCWRADRVLLRNAVYRVLRWLASITSKFSGCNPRRAITEIFKIPVRVVVFHPGCNPDKGCFWAARGWQILPTLLFHLGQVAAVPGRVSAAPSPALQEFPVQPRGASLLSSYTKAQLLPKGHNYWDHRADASRPEKRGWGCIPTGPHSHS